MRRFLEAFEEEQATRRDQQVAPALRGRACLGPVDRSRLCLSNSGGALRGRSLRLHKGGRLMLRYLRACHPAPLRPGKSEEAGVQACRS